MLAGRAPESGHSRHSQQLYLTLRLGLSSWLVLRKTAPGRGRLLFRLAIAEMISESWVLLAKRRPHPGGQELQALWQSAARKSTPIRGLPDGSGPSFSFLDLLRSMLIMAKSASTGLMAD